MQYATLAYSGALEPFLCWFLDDPNAHLFGGFVDLGPVRDIIA